MLCRFCFSHRNFGCFDLVCLIVPSTFVIFPIGITVICNIICLWMGNLYAATPGQNPGVARIYIYIYIYTHIIYVCTSYIYIYIHITHTYRYAYMYIYIYTILGSHGIKPRDAWALTYVTWSNLTVDCIAMRIRFWDDNRLPFSDPSTYRCAWTWDIPLI